MSTITDLDCAALTSAFARGDLSPVEVVRDVLARIERHAAFNAFVMVDAERALDAARQSEARWRARRPLGALDGVPATVKDNILAKGFPTRRGSRVSDTTPAATDAPSVERLREQGAVILGKTCMPEHGWIGVCHSPLTGITRNPWNPAYTPGGSTGGGAVAALLGLGLDASWNRRCWLIADSGGIHRRDRRQAKLRSRADLPGGAARSAIASWAGGA